MIISRTPLRISLAGGGTDMASYYRRHGGSVVSLTINKFVYVSVNKKFDGKTRLSYSITENVDNPGELKHDIARECLREFEVGGVEITSTSDIPGDGTGMGSSSAYAVGLINCLGSMALARPPCKYLAEKAYEIERKRCAHPVGKQDQYAAAHGGLRYYSFLANENVSVEPIFVDIHNRDLMEQKMLLLYTGVSRSANDILKDQERNLETRRESSVAAIGLKNLADELARDLRDDKFHVIGHYLYEGWKLKKRLSDYVSDPALDLMYADAISAGAIGGKLLGAGGGGFFLFWADKKFHGDILKVTGLRQIPFKYEEKGSAIIYDSES